MNLSKLTLALGLAAVAVAPAAAQITPYEQDFESLSAVDPLALTNDGWLIFANVFDPSGGYLYGYGVFGAPNGGPGFSSLVSSGNASAAQGGQQLNAYSDYNNGDHANGNYIEAIVFQERPIGAGDVGATWTLSYDVQAAPPVNGTQDARTFAFIKVLQSSNMSFAQLALETDETTIASMTTFDREQVRITIDPSWAGELIQFGFYSYATNYADTGRYYDNLIWSGGPEPVTASSPEILYSGIAGAPSAAVPGMMLNFTGFGPIYARRGDLEALAFTALTDSGSTSSDELVMAKGEVRAREGDQPAFNVAGDLFGFFDDRVEVNSAGDVVFQNNTTGDSTTDDMIVKSDPLGNLSLVAREGSAFDPVMGTTAGSNLESANVNDDGTPSYYVENVAGGSVTPDTDNFIVTGTSVVAQKGVTMLTGDNAGEFLDTVDFNDLLVSDNGQHWLARADLTQNSITTSEDDCLIVNGEVVVRELQPLPGGDPTEIVDTIGIFGHAINNSGSWIARGDLDPPFANNDWALLDGAVVARTGDPIHAGTSEAWSPSIFLVELNDDGDYLVGGVTDSIDGDRDGVIVLNGERVIVREGDPVDVDGNGLFDDDAYLNFFQSDQAVLSNRAQGLTALFVCTVRDGAGANLAEAIFSIDLSGVIGSTVCNGEPNSLGGGVAAQTAAYGSSSAAQNDLTLYASNLPVGSMGYFVTSQETNLVPNPGAPGSMSAGNLCIASLAMGRYSMSVLVADGAGSASMPVDLTSTPGPFGPTAVMAGDTRYWQLWYRDMDPMGMPTSNFAEAVGVTFD